MLNQKRPIFINLLQISMPPAALVSIGHRVSGFVMVISIPFWIYLLGLSLESAQGFAAAKEILASPFLIFLGLIFFWSLGHHLFAGIRFLLLDIDIGLEKNIANKTAILAIVLGGLGLLVGLGLLL